MNREAYKQHEIYNMLRGLTEPELVSIADFISYLRQRKQRTDEGELLKMEGSLTGYDIDIGSLRDLKEQCWKHVDEEASRG